MSGEAPDRPGRCRDGPRGRPCGMRVREQRGGDFASSRALGIESAERREKRSARPQPAVTGIDNFSPGRTGAGERPARGASAVTPSSRRRPLSVRRAREGCDGRRSRWRGRQRVLLTPPAFAPTLGRRFASSIGHAHESFAQGDRPWTVMNVPGRSLARSVGFENPGAPRPRTVRLNAGGLAGWCADGAHRPRLPTTRAPPAASADWGWPPARADARPRFFKVRPGPAQVRAGGLGGDGSFLPFPRDSRKPS